MTFEQPSQMGSEKGPCVKSHRDKPIVLCSDLFALSLVHQPARHEKLKGK